MDKPFALFDMDGTLIDSMPYWAELGRAYLAARGIHEYPDELAAQLETLTLSESAALFARRFLPGESAESVCAQMSGMLAAHYRDDIPLKPGVPALLDELARRQVGMCVASATARPLMEVCLARLGVLSRFAFVLSCEDVGAGKRRPDVYLAAARRLGAPPSQIAVYEDALYAIRTAKAAGFCVVGVYDAAAARDWPEICRIADETIRLD